MKKLQINGKNLEGANSFLVSIRSSESPEWMPVATVKSLPYNIMGLSMGISYEVKVQKLIDGKPKGVVNLYPPVWVD